MEFLTEDWIYEPDMNTAAFIRELQMDSIGTSVDDFSIANSFSPSINISEQELKNNDFKSTKNYTGNHREKIQLPFSSPAAKIIAFGDASVISTLDVHGSLNKTVKAEAANAVPFGDMCFEDPISPNSIQKLYEAIEYGGPVKRSITRSPTQAQDHVLAERKRREKQSEFFVSLSTMVPGLKKLDKASILGGAIDYIKQLEERQRTLEEDLKKKPQEPLVSMRAKRLRVTSYDDTSSSGENSDDSIDPWLPDIEIRTGGRNLLLNVCCKNRGGIIKEILCEVEKLDLCIIKSSAMPFGDNTLHMSVITEVDGGFCSADDLAENIRRAILKLM